MLNKIQDYKVLIGNKKSELNLLQEQKKEKEDLIDFKKKYSEKLVKARWVLSEVTKQTQNNFKGYVENLVTLGINSVFQNKNLKFILDFEIKRNKSECLLRVQENDEEPFIPKDEMGGSIVDIISFVLRVVLWSLKKDKTRNTIVLDEPFRCTGDLSLLAGQMVKEISNKLGVQILMITHDSNLSEISDKTHLVKHNGGYSNVIES